jgi:hypothetical protein
MTACISLSEGTLEEETDSGDVTRPDGAADDAEQDDANQWFPESPPDASANDTASVDNRPDNGSMPLDVEIAPDAEGDDAAVGLVCRTGQPFPCAEGEVCETYTWNGGCHLTSSCDDNIWYACVSLPADCEWDTSSYPPTTEDSCQAQVCDHSENVMGWHGSQESLEKYVDCHQY